MTSVQFTKSHNQLVKVVCTGHTGYAEYGSDIVCASISAIVGSACLGLTQVLGIRAKIKRNDDDGYLEIGLPKNMDKQLADKAQVIMNTTLVSLLDIAKGYPSNIKVEVLD